MANAGVEEHVETQELGQLAARIFSGGAVADPFPLYAALREHGPVLRVGPTWLLTRYEDIARLLRSDELSNDLTLASPEAAATLPTTDDQPVLAGVREQWLVFRDPPDHTRLRGLVNRAFTPRAVAEQREIVSGIVDELIDQMLERREMDFVADVAYPLPVAVISRLLGVPDSEQHLIQQWTPSIVEANEPMPTPEQCRAGDQAASEFISYLNDLIRVRRRNPGSDLVSTLIAAQADGDRLSEEELVAMIFILLVAGHETTVSVAANGLLALLEQRDEWELLCEEPELVPSAGEELLRFAGPVQFTARVVRKEFELHGCRLIPGDVAMLMNGSANRDPDQFPDPDRLDIRRSPNRHLAFGGGIHFCVGSGLARLELDLLLRGLATRLPDIGLATEEPSWRGTPQLRSLTRLPLRLH